MQKVSFPGGCTTPSHSGSAVSHLRATPWMSLLVAQHAAPSGAILGPHPSQVCSVCPAYPQTGTFCLCPNCSINFLSQHKMGFLDRGACVSRASTVFLESGFSHGLPVLAQKMTSRTYTGGCTSSGPSPAVSNSGRNRRVSTPDSSCWSIIPHALLQLQSGRQGRFCGPPAPSGAPPAGEPVHIVVLPAPDH